MYIDNTFKIALFISLSIHSIGFLLMSGSRNLTFNRNRKEFDKIEVVYIKPKPEPEINKNKPIYNVQKAPPPQYIETAKIIKERLKQENKPEIRIVEKDAAATKTNISMPQITSKEMSSTEYLTYYQAIREKIRRAAHNNYKKQDTGEVYLSFSIAVDGSLQGINLIEEKSVKNQYLRETGFKSIQNASPFPSFPKELDYPILSFNIIISFEAEK